MVRCPACGLEEHDLRAHARGAHGLEVEELLELGHVPPSEPYLIVIEDCSECGHRHTRRHRLSSEKERELSIGMYL